MRCWAAGWVESAFRDCFSGRSLSTCIHAALCLPPAPASAARTVAALEQHASHLMLRVLLGGVPPGLSPTDTQQGLAFLAMLFNATSVARLLCLSLGAAFCAGDSEGQAAAAALLRYPARWAADDQLLALASELLSEALVSAEEVAAPGAAAGASPVAAAAGQGAPGPAERAPS